MVGRIGMPQTNLFLCAMTQLSRHVRAGPAQETEKNRRLERPWALDLSSSNAANSFCAHMPLTSLSPSLNCPNTLRAGHRTLRNRPAVFACAERDSGRSRPGGCVNAVKPGRNASQTRASERITLHGATDAHGEQTDPTERDPSGIVFFMQAAQSAYRYATPAPQCPQFS
jgi:hypothetical protein